MYSQYHKLLPSLQSLVENQLANSPACHDWEHTLRVLANARHLARVEGADMTLVEFAAILHDVGRPAELADQGKTCHARLGGALSKSILYGLGIDDVEFISQVAACVRTHRFRQRHGERPSTLEAKVLYDADKLDSIGAVGLGRSFHFAGRTGARLHNSESEALASESYSRDDTAYREFLVKLRHLAAGMLTREGRRLAEKRHLFMVNFFRQLDRELAGEDLLPDCSARTP
jgi:uncharacterized protein